MADEEKSYVNPWIKWLMFSFNMLFWILSIIPITIGIWSHVEAVRYHGDYYNNLDGLFDVFLNVSIVLILFGVVVSVISLIGAIGALRENVCMLKTFMSLLIIICIAELILGIVAFALTNTIKDKLAGILKEQYIEGYRDNINQNNIIDWFQETFKCCGVGDDTGRRGYRDWERNLYFNCSSPGFEACSVPYSCCKNPYTFDSEVANTRCGAGALDGKLTLSVVSERIWVSGCFNEVFRLANDNILAIALVAFAILVPQLVAILLSRILYGQIEMQRDRYIYHATD